MKINGRMAIFSLLLCIFLSVVGQSAGIAQNTSGGLAWPDALVADSAFYSVWSCGDAPVAMQAAARSWLWGPVPFAVANESYAESSTSRRLVTYLDKGRMEINDPAVDRASQWFVTSGLLVKEMVTGLVQTGNNRFEPRDPAAVAVAGDLGNVTAPTYASFAGHIAPVAKANGSAIKDGLTRDGTLFSAPSPVTPVGSKAFILLSYDSVTGHNIPGVFLDWMAQKATVLENGRLVQDTLLDPLYVLGRPLTEPYWTDVPVKGATVRVLVQLFERRALTYNPTNPPAWQVEMANVGRSYFEWRYGGKPLEPAVSVELQRTGILVHGWNWPASQPVTAEVDLGGGVSPLAGPQTATPDQAGQFSLVLPLNAQLQGALAARANVIVKASTVGGQLSASLPFAASGTLGKISIEGTLGQVSPSRSPAQQVALTARDGVSWSLSLDANTRLIYSEGITATADILRPSMSVSVDGTATGSNIGVSQLHLLSVSRTGATFGYTVQPGGKSLQISGKGWPGEKGVALQLRTLAPTSTKALVTITADSRGDLLGTMAIPAQSALPSGLLWLFAVSQDRGTVLAQVALPFSYPQTTQAPQPPTLIALASSGEQTGGVGSYCWQKTCTDAVGVPLPGDALKVSSGEVLGLRSQYGPDPNVGLSPSKFTARIYAYPANATGQGTVLDGVFYYVPKGNPIYTTGELPGRPFSIPVPSSLAMGKYIALADVTWPDTGTGGGTATYGFTLEIP